MSAQLRLSIHPENFYAAVEEAQRLCESLPPLDEAVYALIQRIAAKPLGRTYTSPAVTPGGAYEALHIVPTTEFQALLVVLRALTPTPEPVP